MTMVVLLVPAFLLTIGMAIISDGPAVFWTCGAYLLWAAFLIARNEWVYYHTGVILERGGEDCQPFESYNTMMARWWVWDINKFRVVKNDESSV